MNDTTLPPDTETSNPVTGLEAKGTVAGQVSTVVDLEAARKAKEAEAAPEDTIDRQFAIIDKLVAAAHTSWLNGRDGRYKSLYDAAPVIKWALDNLAYWDAYRKTKGSKARTVEAQVFDVIVLKDLDAVEISSTTRAIYGQVIGWFAFVCGDDMEEDVAICNLRELGMAKAAASYCVLHPPHFTTTAGRASRGTGRRPGPAPGATTTPATEAVAAVDATIAAAAPASTPTAATEEAEQPPSATEAGEQPQPALSETDALFAKEGFTEDEAGANAEVELMEMRAACHVKLESFMARLTHKQLTSLGHYLIEGNARLLELLDS